MRELTTEQVIEAQLRALNIEPNGIGKTTTERIFDAHVDLMREKGRIVSVSEVGERVGLVQSGVSRYCADLVRAGKMFRVLNPQTGKNAYVPKVV